MIELYIENKKIDITDDLEINFTYETINPDKLSTIKNSFSKTIEIPGTANNNITFGHIFRMDKYITSGNESNINSEYDPHKKVNWFINKNGTVINKGYCTLDNIIIKDEREITYKLTLYGGIGEFFYNLSYNEDGSPKTLKDLYFNWRPKLELNSYGDPLDESSEQVNPLMICTADIVSKAYHTLTPIYNSSGTTDIDKDIVFVPCYSGTYENFDSKHILVSTFNQQNYPSFPFISNDTRNLLNNTFPSNFSETVEENGETITKNYSTIGRDLSTSSPYKYGLVNCSRDLDPSEAGDFRVNEMPVAIRLSKLMNVISNSSNNGGYTVNWDNDILNSPYWNYSWIILGKIKQEENNLSISSIQASQQYDNALNRIAYEYYDHDILYYNNIAQIYNINYPMQLTIQSINSGKYTLNINYIPTCYTNYGAGIIEFLKKYNNTAFFSGSFKTIQYDGSKLKGWEEWNTHVILHKVRTGGTIKYIFADIYYFSNNIQILNNSSSFGTLHNNFYNIEDTFALNSIRNRIEEKIGRSLDGLTVHNVILENPELTAIEDITFPDSTTLIPFAKLKGNSQNSSYQVEFENDISNLSINEEHFYMWTHCDWKNDNIRWSTSGIYGIDKPIAWDEYWAGFNLHNTGSFFSFGNSDRISTSYVPDNLNSNYFLTSFALDNSITNGFIANYSAGFNTLTLTKDLLFADSYSPMKYLTDFCKLMNYRFLCDNVEKKIDILTIPNYYTDNGISLDEKVDLGRNIETKPVITQYKTINFGLSTPETYPTNIFNKINKEKFNIYHFATGIEYNTTETYLLNDNIYKNTIDWQLSSPYFNKKPQVPSAYNTISVNWTLFDTSNLGLDHLNKKDLYTYGDSANYQLAIKDPMPKIGMFDKNNKIVDCFPSLVFLNGFLKNYDYDYIGDYDITLSANSVNTSHYINSNGEIVSSSYQDIYIYNNIDTSLTYKITCSFSSGYSSYIVNYYDSLGTRIGTEYIQTNANLVDAPLTIPSGTTSIRCNFRKSDPDNKLKVTRTVYSISPKIMFSNDTVEQYYLNGQRCYLYDFKYDDEFVFWGVYSSNQKGYAAPWTIPMFSRDLYNKYNSNTSKWEKSSLILASWNINYQNNISDLTNITENTVFIKDTNFIFSKQIYNTDSVDNNSYTFSTKPYDPINTGQGKVRIFDTNWNSYLKDIYNINTREVTLYANLSGISDPNDIMRNIYTWKGNKWIITKMQDYRISNITSDYFTKITMHKIVDINAFIKNN